MSCAHDILIKASFKFYHSQLNLNQQSWGQKVKTVHPPICHTPICPQKPICPQFFLAMKCYESEDALFILINKIFHSMYVCRNFVTLHKIHSLSYSFKLNLFSYTKNEYSFYTPVVKGLGYSWIMSEKFDELTQ